MLKKKVHFLAPNRAIFNREGNAEVSSCGIRVGWTPISNLRYADDTALIERSHERIEQLTKSVNEVGKNLHLKFNVKTTREENKGSGSWTDKRRTQHRDWRKKSLTGSTNTATANCTRDIKSRIAIATRRMIELLDLWNDSSLQF